MSHLVPLDLEKLEGDAKRNATKQVAAMIQRPDQLEKVDQYKRRVVRKKAAVEAMLKTALQSQLEGVRTGLSQLQAGLHDVKETKQSLQELEDTYKSTAHLQEKLNKVRDENLRHRQLAAAVENLKHIFTVPETVKKTGELITDGKLLHAHKCLTDLEMSRDDLLLELDRQPSVSQTDKNMILNYFKDVSTLSQELGKQLWIRLQRTLTTVRRDPTAIVTALRIIEREERKDSFMLKRQEQTGFLPPGRPKKWREKCFEVLGEAVAARIEGSQLEDRTLEKMWLVRHLEITRQLTIEDLRVVKSVCEPCFPPEYDVVQRYLKMYHEAIGNHILELISQDLEKNEIVSLLTWVNAYWSTHLMNHPELKDLNKDNLGPLLENSVLEDLQQKYLTTMKKDIEDWMSKALQSDLKDWFREIKPDSDAQGYFSTPMPIILFEMIEQNLQVAAHINKDLTLKVLDLCIDELQAFAKMFSGEMRRYKERHFEDRGQPPCYIHYMMANINNCLAFVDLMDHLCNKYIKGDSATEHKRFRTMAKIFESISREGCSYLLEEVFMDLREHLDALLTRDKWYNSQVPIDTICITVEDYCSDFIHLKPKSFTHIMVTALERVMLEYIKALVTPSRKITFRNYEDRRTAGDKIVQEADQLFNTFQRLAPVSAEQEAMINTLPMLAEVLKLQDTAMLALEISTIAQKHPDVHPEQLVNLMALRGDIGKSDARNLAIEAVGEEESRPVGLFTKVQNL
ncbi:exocyst complex component 3 [Lingula anatina]|uniref:Exocyst complex component 3 n=1 Tax=Lingula anatina TaxID=7574 RepID=A0A1S3K7B6_LINAN|nr:exocyst complex component 3 [Lingula anatina]|eukprot:XP_013418387.1 exocyst complex component 3 [Lingula anatina]